MKWIRPRPRKEGARLQLFPFMDVFLCMMGALILMFIVIAQSTRGLVTKAEHDVAQTEAALSETREDLEWKVKHLRTARDKTAADLAEKRLQLSHVEEHTGRLRDELAETSRALGDFDRHVADDEQGAEALRKNLASLQWQALAAEAEAEQARKDKRKRADSYAIIPYEGAHGTRRRPIYIECRADGILLQPEGIQLTDDDFVGAPGPGNPLASALRAIREYLVRHRLSDPSDDGEPYPLLLVRPDGIENYYQARAAMHTWGADFGYELVDGDWQIEYKQPDPALQQMLARAVSEARQRQITLALAAPRLLSHEERIKYRQALEAMRRAQAAAAQAQAGTAASGGFGSGSATGSAGGMGSGPGGTGLAGGNASYGAGPIGPGGLAGGSGPGYGIGGSPYGSGSSGGLGGGPYGSGSGLPTSGGLPAGSGLPAGGGLAAAGGSAAGGAGGLGGGSGMNPYGVPGARGAAGAGSGPAGSGSGQNASGSGGGPYAAGSVVGDRYASRGAYGSGNGSRSGSGSGTGTGDGYGSGNSSTPTTNPYAGIGVPGGAGTGAAAMGGNSGAVAGAGSSLGSVGGSGNPYVAAGGVAGSANQQGPAAGPTNPYAGIGATGTTPGGLGGGGATGIGGVGTGGAGAATTGSIAGGAPGALGPSLGNPNATVTAAGGGPGGYGVAGGGTATGTGAAGTGGGPGGTGSAAGGQAQPGANMLAAGNSGPASGAAGAVGGADPNGSMSGPAGSTPGYGAAGGASAGQAGAAGTSGAASGGSASAGSSAGGDPSATAAGSGGAGSAGMGGTPGSGGQTTPSGSAGGSAGASVPFMAGGAGQQPQMPNLSFDNTDRSNSPTGKNASLVAQYGSSQSGAAPGPQLKGLETAGRSYASNTPKRTSGGGSAFADASDSSDTTDVKTSHTRKRRSAQDTHHGSVAVTRPIHVICYPDRMIVIAEKGDMQGNKTIPLTEYAHDGVDELINEISRRESRWGIAGRGMYWRPLVSVDVADGAQPRYNDLYAILSRSGVEMESKPLVIACPVPPPTTKK